MGSRFGANIQVILCSIRYVLVPTHLKEIFTHAHYLREQKVLKLVREGNVKTPHPNEMVIENRNYEFREFLFN